VSFPYRIERLGKQDRSQFACGIPALNDYLQKQAGQDQRRRVAACYLLVEQATEAIAGYYTLSAGSVLLADLPDATARKLPRYPTVPVVRIGRLAVDQSFRRQSLGGVLLSDGIIRTATSDIGAFAVLVDAKDQDATAFYTHHGFTPFASEPQVLFLPLSDAIKRLSS